MSNETGPGGRHHAPRVFYATLGCRLNQHDTAAMRAALTRAGYGEAARDEAPDVIVVNTCTVTARADQEARQLVRSLARRHPGSRLVVTGCYAQRAPDEVGRLPGVSLVVGTRERDQLAALLGPAVTADGTPSAHASPEAPAVHVGAARARRPFVDSAPLSFGRTRALLKVQDGCDAFCSYCVVPYVRGRSRSLPLEQALDQGRRLLDAGFHEIVITGADLGSYGRDFASRRGLPDLVEGLLGLGSRHRIRLSSIEPNKVDPALVTLLGSEPRLCRHVHLPLQSGSASVLRAMRRPYAPEAYVALIESIASRGRVAIGADVISGFPGEEERDAEATLALVARLPIAYLHVFRYSPRPGTRAERGASPGAVSPRSRAHAERLRALSEEKRSAFYRSLVGSVLPGIVERAGPDGAANAMTDLYAPVRLEQPPAERGIVPVTVRSFQDGILEGIPGG